MRSRHLTAITLIGLVALMAAGCSGDGSTNRTVTVTDLLIPQWQGNTVTGYDPVTIQWGPQEAPPPVLQVCLSDLWEEGGDVSIDKATFRERCVLPYINGLWLDKDVLLRTPAMVGQEAEDKLIEPPAGMKGWPVFYPRSQHFVKQLIAENNADSGIELDVRPLPLFKPNARSLAGKRLYNNLGLLYLPNSYIVPGDTFNEMYGWDSFFMTVGLLESAAYIHKNLGEALLWDGENQTLRQATLDDARRLFDIAKGMVDNHVYMIRFYGGYILNGNRTYYLTRSQPPLFTQEALAVYRFQQAHGEAMGLSYTETLAPYYQAEEPRFQSPVDFDEWMSREVVPAAVAYYDYWTDPHLCYTGWNPFRSAVRRANPRVVEVAAPGETRTVLRPRSRPACRYYTEGVGPAPEVAKSTAPQNRQLYPQAARFFEAYPEENPRRPFSLRNLYWNRISSDAAGLTQDFYASDRAVRASGYDLSGRYGPEGQYATDYAPVSLNSLLFQMGTDVASMLRQFGRSGWTGARVSRYLDEVNQRLDTARTIINDLMWKPQDEGGYFSDVRVRDVGTATRHTYPYGTMFYPFWADGLVTDSDRLEQTLSVATTEQQVRQDTVLFTGDGDEQTPHWIRNDDQICQYDTSSTELECQPSRTQAFLYASPSLSSPGGYGIPTSLVDTGNQWDNPAAWAPVVYFAVQGLNKWEDQLPDAAGILNNALNGWTTVIDAYFARSGTLVEKYITYDPYGALDVSRGYTTNNLGFGWTNAVYMVAFEMLQE